MCPEVQISIPKLGGEAQVPGGFKGSWVKTAVALWCPQGQCASLSIWNCNGIPGGGNQLAAFQGQPVIKGGKPRSRPFFSFPYGTSQCPSIFTFHSVPFCTKFHWEGRVELDKTALETSKRSREREPAAALSLVARHSPPTPAVRNLPLSVGQLWHCILPFGCGKLSRLSSCSVTTPRTLLSQRPAPAVSQHLAEGVGTTRNLLASLHLPEGFIYCAEEGKEGGAGEGGNKTKGKNNNKT